MRLICENCDAQYEVDADMIPAEGRDVQCSACSQVWFQPGPALQAEPPEEDEPELPPLTEAELAALRRPPLDDEMRAILREEAERESTARAADAARQRSAAVISPDRDQAAHDPSPATPGTREDDVAEMIEVPETVAPDSAPPPPLRAHRRDLLPDIEQINSTLDAAPGTDFAAGDAMNAAKAGRGGFARGFALSLLVCLIAATVYLKAEPLRALVPAAAPALDGYVTQVNAARHGLDRFVAGFLSERG